MNAFHDPQSYRIYLFKVGGIRHGTGRGEGSVTCLDLTLFCRFYFPPSGLLEGWYLHPNSASYLSTWMVSHISPLASECSFSIQMNYGPNCSLTGLGTWAHSPLLVVPWCPTFSNRQPLLKMKTRDIHLLEHQHRILLSHFPKTSASGWSNTRE